MSEKPTFETSEAGKEAEFAQYDRIRTLYEQNEQWKKNIWGPEEWEKYGIELTLEQLENAKHFPWRQEILTSPDALSSKPEKGEAPLVIEEHMAIFMPGKIRSIDKGITKEDMTLMELQKLEPKLFFYKQDPWYAKESFAAKEHEEGWRLIRKEIVPNSTERTFYEQVAMLTHHGLSSDREEVRRAAGNAVMRFNPFVRGRLGNHDALQNLRNSNPERAKRLLEAEMVRQEQELAALLKDSPYDIPRGRDEALKEILYYMKNKERLNKDYWARCRDLSSDGLRVSVGPFKPSGLNVSHDLGVPRLDTLGLSASRKFHK